MAKIVRDLSKKGSFTISLKDGDILQPKKRKPGAVDLSEIGKQKFVVTTGIKNEIRDVVRKEDLRFEKNGKSGQVFFFHVDTVKNFRFNRTMEMMRIGAVGVLILFVINIVNVYQRGISLKNDVIASASSGYEDLLKGGEEAKGQDFTAAEGSFDQADKSFSSAIQNIAFLQTNSSTFYAKEKTVDSVQNLLSAAKSIATAGKDFSRGIENLKLLPDLFIQENMAGMNNGKGQQPAGKSLTDKLKEDLVFLQKAQNEVQSAYDNLQHVSPEILPVTLQDKLESAKDKVAKLLQLLDSAERKIPAVLDLLGDRYPHSYLILLQNDTEARPTGGFIGSYMLVDINDGYITKMEFHDVYDADGQLKDEIPAPEDIAKITKYWRLRDSNYSPDFAISAEKAAWFLQKEKGPSVESVIAVNQSFVSKLLEITGPVKVESLDAKLTKDNYQLVLSYMVESKLAGADTPKKVLGEFIAAFQKELFQGDTLKKSIAAFIEGYKEKSIMFYSRHAGVEQVFDDLGMTARVNETAPKEDYLNVIGTSVRGNKSDLYIQQTIQHNTLINPTGLVLDELTIDRKHTWTEQLMGEWKATLKAFGYSEMSDGIKDILGRGINKSMIKVYVPQGSILTDAVGIKKEDILTRNDDEINKTYFMFEMDTAPGSEQKITITYQLPQNLSLLPVDTYKLKVQRQPGKNPSFLVKQIFFPAGLRSYSEYPKDVLKKYESGNLYYDGKLEKDLYLSALVGQ